jgi:hypothetical protein
VEQRPRARALALCPEASADDDDDGERGRVRRRRFLFSPLRRLGFSLLLCTSLSVYFESRVKSRGVGSDGEGGVCVLVRACDRVEVKRERAKR